MFILVVGAGRVGSTLAKWALSEGHEVSVLDEDPLSHERLDNELDTSWEEAGGRFTVGTALEIDALAGAGKVGWNLARELIEKGHEVTLLENDRRRYLVVEQELEHAVQYGDASE